MLRKTSQECKPNPDPLKTPDYTEADVQAVRAWVNGYATEDQQKRSAVFIINTICGTYDTAFRPGANDRVTNIALGRQLVGQNIVYYANKAPTETPVAKIAARVMGTK